jgi:hypothetical protein
MQSTPQNNAPNPTPNNQGLLSPELQAQAQQIFETQVKPLQKSFKERETSGLEGLARRGLAFGETGAGAITDIYEAQDEAEAGLMGLITGNVMEQAYRANELAKQREFAKEERLGQQEFQAEQTEAQRQFSTQEREAIQNYNTALQERGFEQQVDLLELQNQQNRFNRNEEAIFGMLQSGQITSDNANQIIGNILDTVLTDESTGEFMGFQFTPDDELLLQRQATQAGLTVDEYIDLREKLGSKQKDVVLDQLESFVFNPELMQREQERMARIATGQEDQIINLGQRYAEALNRGLTPQEIEERRFQGRL